MTTTKTAKGRNRKSLGAPYQSNAEAPTRGMESTLTVAHPNRTVNTAQAASVGQSGVQIVPVTGSAALERASVHDVLLDGRRIGGVCWARGAWRILSNAQARFASRDDAVEALLARRGRSQ